MPGHIGTMPAKIETRELTPGLWADLEALFGANGACGGCWCMYWRQERGEDWSRLKGAANKRRFRSLVERGLAHGVLARAYTSILKYDIGLAESERALQINPSDAEALLARAAVLLWTGRVNESIAAAETALRLNVGIGPEASLNLGLAYLLGRRYADAVKLLEAARARYPTYPLLDFPLAAAYAELGRTVDSFDAVEQGKLKNPHFDLASFGSRFQDPALQRRVEESLRKAGVN